MTARSNTSRERHDARVAAHADRVLSETRFARLRTRRARLAIVTLELVLILATPVVWLTVGSIAGLAVVVVAIGGLWVLRRSVRVIADLPDDVLDERQRRRRDSMYVEAYRWFAGVIVIAASAGLVAFIVNADADDRWTVTLTWDLVMGGFWTIWLLTVAMPSMVVALHEPSEPDIDPDS